MGSLRMRTALGVALAAALGAIPAVAADDVAGFYAGKNVSLIIGSSPGGGYDAYGRLIARHLGDHIPGKPTILPVNMPGAGSARAIEYLETTAPKDGTAIAAIFPGAVLEPLIGEVPMRHDPSKLNFLGSANNDVFLCVIRADAPVKSFGDAFSKEAILAASAEGGSSRDFPVMLNNVLGTKFRLVSGYPGSREMTLAIQEGEVQGECGLGWSSVSVQHPDWISGRASVKILVQESSNGRPELQGKVPLTIDFAKTEEQRQILELVYSQEIFSRPYVAAPEVPAVRVAALRQAFLETVRDPKLRADAAKMRLDVDAMSGAEVQRLVAKIYATPPRIVADAKQALVAKR